MRRKKRKTAAAIGIFLMTVFALGCGDDNGNGEEGGGGGDVGAGSFDISGDFSGQKEGSAHFDDDYPMSGFSRITIFEGMTWDLLFTTDEPFDVGTYELGNYGLGGQDVGPSFHHSEAAPYSYGTGVENVYDTIGTLEITEADDEMVSGTFFMSLVRTDEEGMTVDGGVEITNGEFTAYRR